MKLCPFNYTDPASDLNFINRIQEQEYIFRNIQNGVSTAIVGNSGIGKTSFLKRIKSPQALIDFGLDAEQCAFADLSLEALNQGSSPEDFWWHVCKRSVQSNPNLASPLRAVINNKANLKRIEEYLEAIRVAKGRIIVLVDEFDQILRFPNLAKSSFINEMMLKSRSSNKVICFVITSTKSMRELNEDIYGPDNVSGSGLIGFMEQVVLGGLDKQDILPWLKSHLVDIEPADTAYRLAGEHPRLLHMAGKFFWYQREKGTHYKWDSSENKNSFINLARDNFELVWNTLKYRAQKSLVLIVIRDLLYDGAYDALAGAKFKTDSIPKNLILLRDDLEDMSLRGMVMHEDGDWRISSAGFRLWLRDRKIAPLLADDRNIEEWIRNKQIEVGNFTFEEIEFWKTLLKPAVPMVIETIKKKLLP